MAEPVQPPPRGRLLRRTHLPTVRGDTAQCLELECDWVASLHGGEDLHRVAKAHAGRTGHRVTVEERRSLYTTYEEESGGAGPSDT